MQYNAVRNCFFFSVEEDAEKEDSVAKRQRGNKRRTKRKSDSGEIVAEW